MSADRLPWGKFVWAHWENDEALALCSMGAQGFWMRLLCIAVKENGYVLIAGKAPTAAKLARIVRASESEVDGWLHELETEGVFSRTGEHVIYSRRIVNEAKEARRNRENGSKGGNPKLRKDTRKTEPDNPSVEPPPQPPGPEGVKADKIREESEEKGPTGPVGSAAPSDVGKADVDRAWAAGNQRGRERSSRKEVERALKAASNRGHAPSAVIAGLTAYFESPGSTKNDGEFAKGVHRMIENDRWLEFAPSPLLDGSATIEAPSPARQRAWMTELREQPNSWRPERGPAPGQAGCRVGAEIQSEFGIEPAAPQPVGKRAA